MGEPVTVIDHPDGQVVVTDLGDRRRVELRPGRPDVYVLRLACETPYPLAFIQATMDAHAFGSICESLGRDDDVRETLPRELFSFVPPARFRGRRLLDFGCGFGCSTAVLGRMLPDTTIVGLELDPKLLQLAEGRAQYHRLVNIQLVGMPAPTVLPGDLGTFDFIVLSAVYEHMLPAERHALMPALWARLNPGGVLFLHQTPHRWYPIETHSTHLPLVNYLPDRLAMWAARHLSRVGTVPNRARRWDEHLRGGLRGATEREILAHMAGGEILPPCVAGQRDRVDVWYAHLSPRYRPLKRVIRFGLKTIHAVTGTVLTPNLSLAIRKPGD